MESLGIDIKLLLAQIINFILFFFIFKKFIAKPFSNFLNLEINKEKEKEKILEDLRTKEENLILKEKKAQEKIKEQFDTAIKNAKKEALIVKDDIIVTSKKEADLIILKGKKQVEDERITMQKEVKRNIVDLSVFLVQKALNNFLTPDLQKKLTQHILKNFSKELN